MRTEQLLEHPAFTTRAPCDLAGWANLFDYARLPVLASTAATLEDMRAVEDAVDAHQLEIGRAHV